MRRVVNHIRYILCYWAGITLLLLNLLQSRQQICEQQICGHISSLSYNSLGILGNSLGRKFVLYFETYCWMMDMFTFFSEYSIHLVRIFL